MMGCTAAAFLAGFWAGRETGTERRGPNPAVRSPASRSESPAGSLPMDPEPRATGSSRPESRRKAREIKAVEAAPVPLKTPEATGRVAPPVEPGNPKPRSELFEGSYGEFNYAVNFLSQGVGGMSEEQKQACLAVFRWRKGEERPVREDLAAGRIDREGFFRRYDDLNAREREKIREILTEVQREAYEKLPGGGISGPRGRAFK